MAKVTGPLMSMTASGAYGGTLVFDHRGFVRQLVIPANPQTGGQGDARSYLASIQAALQLAGLVVIAALKAASPTGYRWNSWIVGKAIGPLAATIKASLVAFTALTATPMGLWNTAFTDVIPKTLEYADIDPITAGAAAFCLCRALFAEGIVTSPGAPGAANATEWHTAVIAVA